MRAQVEKQFKIWNLRIDGREYHFSSFWLLAHEFDKLKTESEVEPDEMN